MAKAKVSKFKVGDKARVIGNSAGHGSSIGDTVTIIKLLPTSRISARTEGGQGWSYFLNDLEPISCTKKDLETFIEEQEAEITTAKMKLKYLKETDSEEFDESEFKIYNALTVLDGAKSKIEKARILKDILNG